MAYTFSASVTQFKITYLRTIIFGAMKKLIFCLVMLFGIYPIYAQRFGYINSQKIVDKLPQYAEAKREIETLTEQWQQEIDTLQLQVTLLRRDFEAEKVLFTDLQKQQKLELITEKENELKALQTKYFGFDGQLFKKRDELLKNVQEKVFQATQKVARKRKLHFIFDKASDLSIVYSDPIYDFTEDVMAELGLTPKNQGGITNPKGDKNSNAASDDDAGVGQPENTPSSPSTETKQDDKKPTTPTTNKKSGKKDK
jgi:outer membrane protein